MRPLPYLLRLGATPRRQGRMLTFSCGGPIILAARKAECFSQPVFRSQVLHLAGRSASSRTGRLAPFFLAADLPLRLLIAPDAISRPKTGFRSFDPRHCARRPVRAPARAHSLWLGLWSGDQFTVCRGSNRATPGIPVPPTVGGDDFHPAAGHVAPARYHRRGPRLESAQTGRPAGPGRKHAPEAQIGSGNGQRMAAPAGLRPRPLAGELNRVCTAPATEVHRG